MIQFYWAKKLGGMKEVTVKSRAEQKKCQHEWRSRANRNKTRHGDSWRIVCKLCGACCR